MEVIKRQGYLVEFDPNKIKNAIEKAMAETTEGIDGEIAEGISRKIQEMIRERDRAINVEEIQDMVEYLLMETSRKDVAKKYIIYRYSQTQARMVPKKKKDDYLMVTDDFVSSYKHKKSPMGRLGDFVYYRTYSRYLDDLGRREYWWETVRRAVEYNTSLLPTSRKEAEALYDNIFNLKQFLSGRTFWVGNTDVSKFYPLSNFNCAFSKITSIDDFRDLFYLLMVGAGVGARVLPEDVAALPKFRTSFELIHRDYDPVPKEDRKDYTALNFHDDTRVEITIGDSKEGWAQALKFFLEVISAHEYRHIETVIIDYSSVRPKGEKLKTFGGSASGYESVKNMFNKIASVIQLRGESDGPRVALRPLDCLDICNIIGENVVVGGVRRTAEMIIIDADDQACIDAKSSLYRQIDGKWEVNKDLIHRQMSNNSIYYKKKPSREKLHWQLEKMRYSGEPGWVNGEAAEKRRPNMAGVNPCGEILLDSHGVCNLTTINVYAFVQNGVLDEAGLYEAQRLSARAGYRMTCVELELPTWNYVQGRDRLLGCSLTGWQDMVNAVGLDKEGEAKVLRKLRAVAREAADEYARSLGHNSPILVTTVKPEGTLSQLPAVSSGVHYSHSEYFIRRVRINSHDPLVKVCEELGYPVHPEVGQDWSTCVTKVVEFPIKAPPGRTKYDVTAIEQLENYKLFMENYVDHNCSITVSVRNDEWDDVEEWVWNNWDDLVAVSFLPLDDSFYELLPYEAIGKEEYDKRVAAMKPFIPSLIQKYEKSEVELDIGTDGCEGGICPVR